VQFIHIGSTDGAHVHGSDITGFPGKKFERNIPGSSTKIKNVEVQKVNPVLNDIKYPFFGKISRWPAWE
jgi:hypothetical protein